jgi:hypothetical protein
MHRMVNVYSIGMYSRCECVAASSALQGCSRCHDQANVVFGLGILLQMDSVEVATEQVA